MATAPPPQVSPYTANLISTIDRLKLDFDRVIPIHYPADSRAVAKAELMRAGGRSTN
jgi:hypothetical protein